MKIKVLEIIGQESYLVKPHLIDSNQNVFINRNEINGEMKKQGFSFKKSDSIEYKPSYRSVIGYKNGNQFMSKEDFDSKITYFDSDSSEEETLRAIANRKEKEGFEPVYEEIDFKNAELEIYGKVEETNSKFIHCAITDRWETKFPVVFSLNENVIAVDEYNSLAKQYSSHGKFEKLDRNYIEYAKINNNYAFTNNVFSEKRNDKLFQSLKDAQDFEKALREKIRYIVKTRLFPEKMTNEKKILIVSHLKAIKKVKSKNVMDEMLQILIDDILEYKSEIQLK